MTDPLKRLAQEHWVCANRGWGFDPALYLVKEELGPCKVGVAEHPFRRLSTLQCGNPRKLHLVAIFCGPRDVCLAVEKVILRRFAHLIKRGEWINLPSDVVLKEIKIYSTEAA